MPKRCHSQRDGTHMDFGVSQIACAGDRRHVFGPGPNGPRLTWDCRLWWLGNQDRPYSRALCGADSATVLLWSI